MSVMFIGHSEAPPPPPPPPTPAAECANYEPVEKCSYYDATTTNCSRMRQDDDFVCAPTRMGRCAVSNAKCSGAPAR